MKSVSSRTAVLLAAGLYVSFVLYFQWLRFDLFQSDVVTYWRESQAWRTPFSTWWVPGYPLLIAASRALTADSLPPILLMWILAGTGYLVAVHTAYRLAVALGAAQASTVALMCATFPLAGIIYSVYPIADSWAVALLLQCVLRMERQQWGLFVFTAGLVLIVHKAAWFFVPPLWLAVFLQQRHIRGLLALAGLPLAIWIIAGAGYHQDPLWFMRWSVTHLVKSKGAFPILDGLIGPLMSASPARIAKGLIVAVTLFGAVLLMWRSFHWRFWSGMCVALSVALMCTVINSYEIWAAVRFSKMLVVPIAVVIAHEKGPMNLFVRAWFAPAVLMVGIVSNLAYAYYLARIYSGD